MEGTTKQKAEDASPQSSSSKNWADLTAVQHQSAASMCDFMDQERQKLQAEREALEEERKVWQANANKLQRCQLPNRIKLDVGGKVFAASLATLTSVKDSFFHSMFSGRWPLKPEDDGCFFIDRDPKAFPLILNFLRGKKIDVSRLSPEKLEALREDAEYYNIQGLLGLAPPKEVLQEFFGERSGGIILSDSNLVASHSSSGLCGEFVLSKTVFTGPHHVLYRLKIVTCGNWVLFGVIDRTPGSASPWNDPGSYAITSNARYTAGKTCNSTNPFSSGDEVTVELDCGRRMATVKNVTQGHTHKFDLPHSNAWRLHVNLYNTNDAVRILEVTRVTA